MPRAHRLSQIVALLIAAPGLGACDLMRPVDLTDIFGSPLLSISVAGDSDVVVGDTIRLKATGSVGGLIGLLSYDPLRDAKWSSSDTSIAMVIRPAPSPADTLASPILVRGIRPGRVVIEASTRGVIGSKVVVVTRVITRPSTAR
jgi:hypothetical protein